MRVRTAKQRAQRIDLYYFKRAHGMRRWRYVLSAAVPLPDHLVLDATNARAKQMLDKVRFLRQQAQGASGGAER